MVVGLFSCCKPERGRDTMLPLEDVISTDSILDAGLSRQNKSNKILQAPPTQIAVETNRSPRSLFEASAFRIASHQERARQEQNKPEADDYGLPSKFLEHYMRALADANEEWASAPEVADMFAEDVRMTGQDKKTTEGKSGVIRRLNKGVAMLVKMAGADADIPEWDIDGPMYAPETMAHEFKCTIRRGAVMKISFRLQFFIIKGKIASFTNSRL